MLSKKSKPTNNNPARGQVPICQGTGTWQGIITTLAATYLSPGRWVPVSWQILFKKRAAQALRNPNFA